MWLAVYGYYDRLRANLIGNQNEIDLAKLTYRSKKQMKFSVFTGKLNAIWASYTKEHMPQQPREKIRVLINKLKHIPMFQSGV